MKSFICAAAAVSLVVPSAAFAGGHEGEGGPGPAGGPPPAVIAAMNLGGAGLLTAFNANSQKGVTSGRGGRDATRIGAAGGTGVTDGYQHDTRTFLPSIGGSKSIQGGSANLTFSIGTNISNEQPNQTAFNTEIPGVSIGYENYSDPNAAWSVTLTYEERTTDSDQSPVVSEATSTELRFAYVRKLNDQWGVANQTYYTVGENTVTTPGGASTSDETEIYTQFELVGAFGTDTVGFVPEGWKLHPTFGVSFQTATSEAGGESETNEDGSVWAKAQLAKGARPGTWAPNFTLGLEHVYQTDTGDLFIDEDTYAILGAGVTYLGDGGSFVAAFEARRGLNGNRQSATLVAGYTFDF